MASGLREAALAMVQMLGGEREVRIVPTVTICVALGWVVWGSDRGQGLGSRHLGCQSHVFQAGAWAKRRRPPQFYLCMVSVQEKGESLKKNTKKNR